MIDPTEVVGRPADSGRKPSCVPEDDALLDSDWPSPEKTDEQEDENTSSQFGELPVVMESARLDSDCRLVRHGEKPTASTVSRRLRADVRAARIFDTRRRYGPAWSSGWWKSLLGREEGMRSWASTTAMITLAGNRQFPIGRQIALLSKSSAARQKALSRALSGVTQWASLTVIGAYQTGHAHLHIGLWLSQHVSEAALRRVVDSHTGNCSIAREGEHGAPAVTVRPAESDSSRGLVSYLGGNVPGLNCREDRSHGLLGEAGHRQLLAGTLEALNMRPIRPGWSEPQ